MRLLRMLSVYSCKDLKYRIYHIFYFWQQIILYFFTGPLPNTVLPFWKMVWQVKSPTIVMLTNVVEGGKDKCSNYWPIQDTMTVGPFSVTITSQQILADYTIRSLILKVGVTWSSLQKALLSLISYLSCDMCNFHIFDHFHLLLDEIW